MPSYQQYKETFRGQQMPFAFVDLDLLDQNIRDIAARAVGKRVRIASKSIRVRSLLRTILDADPIYQGLMSFTIPEAVWLSNHGFDDLLVGYPAWRAEQIRAACAEARRGKTLTLMIDSVEHVEHLQYIAAEEGVTLPVCIDVDMSLDLPGLHFGVWRSGVTEVEHALIVFEAIRNSPNIRLDGVMGYEAQIAGVADTGSGPKSTLIRLLKAHSVKQIADLRAAVVDALCAAGADLRFVNGGGTGSIETTKREDAVTEVTVGSGFFSPKLFDHYRAFRHQPAAGFAVEIVRQPNPTIYTCHGGGYIASGAVGEDKQPGVYLPEGARLTSLEGAGEVQTPIVYDGPERLALGDPIFLRHSKAGELCERFNSVLLVRDGSIIGEAATYRGEGCAFL